MFFRLIFGKEVSMRARVFLLFSFFALTMLGLYSGVGIFSRIQAQTNSVRFQIDPGQSKFIVKASRGGLLWFKGHSHLIGVKDFSGTVEITPDLLNPASLQMTVRADSLEETSDEFTPQQKQIIKKELEEIVLETAKYPEMTFKSTDVKGEMKNGQFEVKIGGDLTLHGVTKKITIPARVSLSGDTLRAQGEFEIDRKNFNVNATNAFHGLVRVQHGLKFTFDIVAHRV